jgi:hypothetical protein
MVWVVTLPFLLIFLVGCREQISSPPAPEPVNLQFMFPLNSYYSFDNWKLSPSGSRIFASRFRTSWTVADTGAVAIGFPGVAIVIDSTFARDVRGADSLVQTLYRYFRTSPNGDVFEFGFIARLFEQRDTINVNPKWDKLLSPSAQTNMYWSVETNDSSTVGTVYARFLPGLETVRDSINGVSLGVLAYHVEITGRNLTLGLWVGGSPPTFLRLWDQSDVLYNRVFQELRMRRTAG